MTARPKPLLASLPTGVNLHYRLQGDPSKPLLVFLNGLLSDTTMWAGVLPHLSPHFRILTFDFRGQGRSESPEGQPYTVALLAEDAWALLEHLGLRNPWLMGLSNGSNVVLEMMASREGAARGAVLTSAMPGIDFSSRLRIQHWIQCLEVGGPLLQFDAVAPYLWGDRFLEARHGILRAYHQVVSAGRGDAAHQAENISYEGARRQMEGVLDWDGRPCLPRIQAPVLVLSGAEDLLTPPWKCRETAEGIAGARFEVVPRIGHAYPVEDPRGYADRVIRFVNEMSNVPETRGQS